MECLVYWLTSIAALIGVGLNIRKHVACFYVWSCTNAVWVYADASHGLVPQACLQCVYFLLSLYGIRKWRQDANNDDRHDRDSGQ